MHLFPFVETYLGALSQNPQPPTVQELCRSLGVHRSAFYRNFHGVDDLDRQFLSLLYLRKVGSTAANQKSCSDLVCYFTGIARTMSGYPDFFRRVFEDRRYLHYRETWVTLVREDVRSRWPDRGHQRLVAPDHHARFRYSLGLVQEYLAMVIDCDEGQWRPLAFALIQFMAGGRLRVLGKCRNLAALEDPELNQWLEAEEPDSGPAPTMVSAAM